MRVLIAGGNSSLQQSIIRALGTAGHSSSAADAADLREHGAQVEPRAGNDRDWDAAVLIDRSVTPLDALDKDEPSLDIPRSARRIIRVEACPAQASVAADSSQVVPADVTIRTSVVYGVGSDPITLFLILMRSLPAVPLLGEKHEVRPLWHEDLARAIAAVVTDPMTSGRIGVAGRHLVSHAELYDRIAQLIDRRPVRVPIPEFLAAHGARLAEALQMRSPFNASYVAFVKGEEEGDPAADQTLERLIGEPSTTLDDGLRRIVMNLDELTPKDGVGTLEVKRFSVDIHRSGHTAAELLRLFRGRFGDFMPIKVGVEPVAPDKALIEGNVLTMALPGRGHVQVRVEEVRSHHVIVATLRGHVLAGIVRFAATDIDDGVRFEVVTCDRAANALDWITLTVGGARVQDANWAKVVRNVASAAGGTAQPVQTGARKLRDEEAASAEQWIAEIVGRQPAESPAS